MSKITSYFITRQKYHAGDQEFFIRSHHDWPALIPLNFSLSHSETSFIQINILSFMLSCPGFYSWILLLYYISQCLFRSLCLSVCLHGWLFPFLPVSLFSLFIPASLPPLKFSPINLLPLYLRTSLSTIKLKPFSITNTGILWSNWLYRGYSNH